MSDVVATFRMGIHEMSGEDSGVGRVDDIVPIGSGRSKLVFEMMKVAKDEIDETILQERPIRR